MSDLTVKIDTQLTHLTTSFVTGSGKNVTGRGNFIGAEIAKTSEKREEELRSPYGTT